MYFDKQRFADLLKQAKGERSINRYGVDSGVDPAYISRLLRCMVSNSPSAAIIKKLADSADNGVTVNMLMVEAGYLKADPSSNPESDANNAPDHHKSNRWQEWEKVIEEAARYNIPPEMALDLITSVGKSINKTKK
ncbi:MAG TPA: hypothetical protein VN441_04880 [Syntrophomonas sp.]|nr:hypothetical protein [Syntrophomonas sp.]